MKKLKIIMSTILLLFLVCCTDDDPIVQFKLTTQVNPPESGSVTPETGAFNQGMDVVLTAIPSEEYVFVNWSDPSLGNENPLTVMMSEDKIITAVFEKKNYSLSIDILGEGLVTEEVVLAKSASGYPSGCILELKAEPLEGWYFVGWSGDCQGTENPLQLCMNKPMNLVAKFEKKIVIDNPIYLKGKSRFDVLAVKEDRVIVDGELMFLDMTAKLTPVDGQNYLLETIETMILPDGSKNTFRKVNFDVIITPGGTVMFSWPETWWELGEEKDNVLGQLLDHTGCIFSESVIKNGTLNYEGHFNGTSFSAKTHFLGKQIEPEPEMDQYWNILGLVEFNFSIELEVVSD